MPQWIRVNSQLGISDDEILQSWSYQDDDGAKIYEGYSRYFICTWGATIQLAIIKKPKSNQEKEPNMSEKIFIMKGLNIYSEINNVAVEVYPRKSNIVDKYDMYHVWILDKILFPYYAKITKPWIKFWWKTVKVDGEKICYRKKYVMGKSITIYCLKAENDRVLTWYEKQKFKDCIVGEETIALEFIEKSDDNVAYLVCLPRQVKSLPFGLRK